MLSDKCRTFGYGFGWCHGNCLGTLWTYQRMGDKFMWCQLLEGLLYAATRKVSVECLGHLQDHLCVIINKILWTR